MINQIRTRMKSQDVTQKELAGMIGVSRQRVNAIMNGRPAKRETIRKIVEALGGTLEVTIKWK